MFSDLVLKTAAKIAIILYMQIIIAEKISQNPKKVAHHPVDCTTCGVGA